MAPTSTCRTSVGVAVLGGYLYAVGGQDGVSCLNIVERYFLIKNKQTNKKKRVQGEEILLEGAVDADKLESRQVLYKSYGDFSLERIRSVFLPLCEDVDTSLSFGVYSFARYDPKENKWTRVASMSTRRLGVAVAVLGGFLYAVGGSDGTSPLNTGMPFCCPIIAVNTCHGPVCP